MRQRGARRGDEGERVLNLCAERGEERDKALSTNRSLILCLYSVVDVSLWDVGQATRGSLVTHPGTQICKPRSHPCMADHCSSNVTVKPRHWMQGARAKRGWQIAVAGDCAPFGPACQLRTSKV